MVDRSSAAVTAERPPTRRRPAGGEVGTPGRRPRPLPPVAPKVRVPELIVGVLVVAGCALAAVLWHTSSTSTRRAVVLAVPVERGHVFAESDFAPAEVSATGMRLIAYEDRAGLVGRLAAADLEAATPVTDSVAVVAVPLADGEGLVGRRLEAGEYPSNLAPDATVQVILVVESSGGVDEQPTKTSVTLPEPAIVDAVTPLMNAADAMVVSLRLPAELAQQVAAADGVRLVQVGA